MAKPRKKWAVSLFSGPPRPVSSQPAAYRKVRYYAGQYAAGLLPFSSVVVWVDERDGRGWQCFERVDLADLPAQAPPGESP